MALRRSGVRIPLGPPKTTHLEPHRLGVEQFPEHCVLSSEESWRSGPSPHEPASSLKPTIRSPGGRQNPMQLHRGRVDEKSPVQLLLLGQCCIVWDEEHQEPV